VSAQERAAEVMVAYGSVSPALARVIARALAVDGLLAGGAQPRQQTKPGEPVIDSGYLCFKVDRHTCGAGPGSGAGHEPGCGLVPEVDLTTLPGYDTLPRTVTAEEVDAAALEEVIGSAWDDGNAVGLDGYVGPGRGAEGPESTDQEAVRARTRFIERSTPTLLAACGAALPALRLEEGR